MNSATKFFLVVLRVAIGWHFFYEGMVKIASEQSGRPFTSEYYLLGAKGPAADFFQGMVDDADGLARLKEGAALTALDERCQQLIEYYDLRDELQVPSAEGSERTLTVNQVQQIETRRNELKDAVRAALSEPMFQQRLADYELMLARFRDQGQNLTAPYSTERYLADENKLQQIRNDLLGVVNGALNSLDRTARDIRVRLDASFDQLALGPPPRRQGPTYWLDLGTAWGLAVVGFCLMVGLATRLACLGALAFLAMFYMSWPPWPGIPDPPVAEGSYLIVNKNLIELIAVLVLMTVPTGQWAGMSGLIRYFILDPLRRRGEPVPVPPAQQRVAPSLASEAPATSPPSTPSLGGPST